MNRIETMLAQPVVEAIGWSLVHFVWQGTVVAITAAGVLVALRRASSNLRYGVACLAMLVLAACPVVTCAWALTQIQAQAIGTPSQAFPKIESQHLPPTPIAQHARIEVNGAGDPEPAFVPRSSVAAGSETIPINVPDVPFASRSGRRAVAFVQPLLPWLVAAWLVGVDRKSVV